MDDLSFFDRVKVLAKENGVTIESVANSAGLTINSYNSYRQHGNLPRANEAVKIAHTLNTNVEFLVTGIENEPLTELKISQLKKSVSKILTFIEHMDRNNILYRDIFGSDEESNDED